MTLHHGTDFPIYDVDFNSFPFLGLAGVLFGHHRIKKLFDQFSSRTQQALRLLTQMGHTKMTDIEYLQMSVTRGLEEILISERGMTLVEVLELLRTSNTFALLMDSETGLYRECPSYVYEFLKDELGWQ